MKLLEELRIVGVRGYAAHAKELVNENMIDCKKEPEISHII